MNILMYADGFGGNTTTFINNEIKYLESRHKLKFACIRKLNSGIFEFDNVEVLPFKMTLYEKVLRRLYLSLNYKNRNFANALNLLVQKIKPDVIHCHFGKEALKIIDNLENKTIPIVIHFHGYDASSALTSKAYVNRLKSVLSEERVYPIFVAKYLRQNLINAGIMIKNETILHCGIDLEKFKLDKTVAKKEEKKVFLQVSSLVEKKGHEYTLQAFAKLLKNDKGDYALWLTGDGERRKLLEDLTKKLGIENSVKFLGYVTPNEAIELMKQADVFVHHSITASNGDQEGIPTALMEAMAMELPVISTIHSGIPELVENGVNGYLVQEKDIETYSQKMNEALKLGKLFKNREIIDSDFELKKHNEQLVYLYQKIVK